MLSYIMITSKIIGYIDLSLKQWGEVSVFEINIRFVGGLLSCFALTGDRMFREKAFLIAERLLPAFDTPTGIPLGIVNMENGVRIKYTYLDSNRIPGILTSWYLE